MKDDVAAVTGGKLNPLLTTHARAMRIGRSLNLILETLLLVCLGAGVDAVSVWPDSTRSLPVPLLATRATLPGNQGANLVVLGLSKIASDAGPSRPHLPLGAPFSNVGVMVPWSPCRSRDLLCTAMYIYGDDIDFQCLSAKYHHTFRLACMSGGAAEH